MKDPLKEFAAQNRAAFDDREPPVRSWHVIERAMGLKSGGLWGSVALWRAAAVVFMLLSGYLLLPEVKQSPLSSNVAAADFKDVEAFYFQQISEKVQLIDEFHKTDGLNGFTQDFQRLEAMYMVLKEEMKTSTSAQVKDALVLNLLVRIDLLNQRLHNLETEYKRNKAPKKEDNV